MHSSDGQRKPLSSKLRSLGSCGCYHVQEPDLAQSGRRQLASMLCTYISANYASEELSHRIRRHEGRHYELEQTLCAKYRALGFEGDQEEILKKKPFNKEKITARATDSSKRNILRRNRAT